MIAHELQAIARNANHAVTLGDRYAVEIEQDWQNEATLYTMSDGSVLVVSGPCVNAYDNIVDATESF